MKIFPGIALFVPVTLILAGCLRSLSVTPGSTADGKPMVELCAELAKADAGTGPLLAVTPDAGPPNAPRHAE